jgi:hypothetical protein
MQDWRHHSNSFTEPSSQERDEGNEGNMFIKQRDTFSGSETLRNPRNYTETPNPIHASSIIEQMRFATGTPDDRPQKRKYDRYNS